MGRVIQKLEFALEGSAVPVLCRAGQRTTGRHPALCLSR
jgi:hypothetical protein